ncbi:Plug domain-containing protein [Mameliella sp. AT18]|uniref:Plug domain-containing protein n=1 Tax=Mameliella sp. AT18 TaxID=3028385 RepID=UPI0008412313|nr:Plug domain-containing protein [Mameliella sp. AT18]MDD9733486.1 Plug domain-containing protein [Mameliella sp. AT18]ODM48907.1 hypothetical protein A9320_18135 [Ruegeria sp. PBVC088]
MPGKQNSTPDSLSLKVIQLLGHHDARGQYDRTDWARAFLLGTDPVFLGTLRIIPEPAQTLLGDHRIDEEQLEQRNPVSVADVFRGESSVAVNGGPAIAQKVVVNGIEESLLFVTIDAARKNKSAFHHTGNILFDPALLNSVEVSEGIGPADAGPNAWPIPPRTHAISWNRANVLAG